MIHIDHNRTSKASSSDQTMCQTFKPKDEGMDEGI